MSDTMLGETVGITGENGDEIEAYLARPLSAGNHGGVVVIHHLPGYDDATKEIVRRFATMGYAALMPNLYSRQAPGKSPGEASAIIRELRGVPDEQLTGDVAGAAAALRRLPTSNGRVGCIGYCSGGRQSILAACTVDLDAAVDCYGALVVGTVPDDFPLNVTPLYDLLPGLRCPVLGLFGADDTNPSVEQDHELDGLMAQHGKDFQMKVYDGAGHAFFNTGRDSFRSDAAADGWGRIEAFYRQHLTG